MKIRSINLAMGFMVGLIFWISRASADLEISAGVSIHSTAEFYEPLGARGTWIEVGSYGRCWRPAGVVVGWRPYCDGYWEWTDCGWYWVSDEPWAWACYHYGTWVYDSDVGWVWVPGVEWAPAWVNWRISDDYIGWVPCGPPGVVFAPSFFVFVESRHFHEHIRPNTVIVNNTLIINKTTEVRAARRESRNFDGREQTVIVNEGPRVDKVEQATGKRFTAVSVREADRQTSAEIPKQLKHETAEPKNTQKPPAVQPQSTPAPGHALKPAEKPETPRQAEAPHNNPPNQEMPLHKAIPPDRAMPQTPPDKTFPRANNEPPLEKRPPKVVNPPQQSQPVAPAPNRSSEKERGNDNNKDDKDHGHDKP